MAAVNHHFVFAFAADAVQVRIHRAHPPHLRRQFHALHQLHAQRPQLVAVEFAAMPFQHMLIGVAEEPAGAGGGIADVVLRRQPHHFAHRPHQRTRREVLASAPRGFLRRTRHQFLVDRALHVHRQRHPVHVVQQIDDELLEQRRVVYLAPRTSEDHAQHPRLFGQRLQAPPKLRFQRLAVQPQQRLPAELRRHQRFALVGRLRELIRHLQEEQQRKLLHVLEAGEASILQHPGIAPRPLADLRSVHGLG